MFSVFQSELNVYYKLFDKENEKAIASLNYLAVVVSCDCNCNLLSANW